MHVCTIVVAITSLRLGFGFDERVCSREEISASSLFHNMGALLTLFVFSSELPNFRFRILKKKLSLPNFRFTPNFF